MKPVSDPNRYRWRCHVGVPSMPDVALRALDSWCASRPFYDVAVWPGQHGFTLTVMGAAADIQAAVNAACDVVRPWCMMVEPGCIKCVGYNGISQ